MLPGAMTEQAHRRRPMIAMTIDRGLLSLLDAYASRTRSRRSHVVELLLWAALAERDLPRRRRRGEEARGGGARRATGELQARRASA